MKNYYSILELSLGSGEAEIRKAYRRLAKQYHPDVNKKSDAQERFIEITEAYEYLINRLTQKIPEYTAPSVNTVTHEHFEDNEAFFKEAREKAREHAKMRYEEFRKQHEAFQQSGFHDLAIILTILMRLILLLLMPVLLLLPFYVAVHAEWNMIFLFLVTWPFAGIIGWYVYDNRTSFFKPGNFYYSPKRVKKIFTETHPSRFRCYYCPSEMADSKAYNMDLFKTKDIKLKSGGYLQHSFNYINKKATIAIPRSRKAFIMHSVITLVKLFSILGSLLFLGIYSIVWRLIAGFLLGEILSVIILRSSHTRSNVNYLLSFGSLLRMIIWFSLIVFVSRFHFNPFNIYTSDYIYLTVTVIIVCDSLLMQILNLILRKYASRPLLRQFPEVDQRFNEGFKAYNDITLVSFIYPIFKWIFG